MRVGTRGPRLGPVADYYTAYLPLLAILALGVGLVVAMFTGNRLLRPTHRTAEKLLTYECGVDPVGEGWAQSHVRYYVYAYLYVIFAVDAVFLFPWATVFGGLGWIYRRGDGRLHRLHRGRPRLRVAEGGADVDLTSSTPGAGAPTVTDLGMPHHGPRRAWAGCRSSRRSRRGTC